MHIRLDPNYGVKYIWLKGSHPLWPLALCFFFPGILTGQRSSILQIGSCLTDRLSYVSWYLIYAKKDSFLYIVCCALLLVSTFISPKWCFVSSLLCLFRTVTSSYRPNFSTPLLLWKLCCVPLCHCIKHTMTRPISWTLDQVRVVNTSAIRYAENVVVGSMWQSKNWIGEGLDPQGRANALTGMYHNEERH